VEDVGGLRIPGIVPATALVMTLVGVLALAGPARRAIRINPIEALRSN
jgi:ABC-type antimicrobial peptide transport system permease subunit